MGFRSLGREKRYNSVCSFKEIRVWWGERQIKMIFHKRLLEVMPMCQDTSEIHKRNIKIMTETG